MRAALLVLLCVFLTPASAGEKLSGRNVDVRTYLAFKAPEANVQKLLPSGWELNSPSAGPLTGFNVLLVLVDSLFSSDAEGKPTAPLRGAVLVVPAKKKGSDAAGVVVVFGIAEGAGAPGAYGVYMHGKASIERTIRAARDGKSTADETWEFATEDGHTIRAQLEYDRGTTTRAPGESKAYSATNPDFFRIYRVDQVTDIARSTPLKVDRIRRISFKAHGPRLAPLFDGSEQLVAVLSIPSYSRSIFLPD